MCVYVVFLDFKRLLACTLNLVIGHLVPQNAEIGVWYGIVGFNVPIDIL